MLEINLLPTSGKMSASDKTRIQEEDAEKQKMIEKNLVIKVSWVGFFHAYVRLFDRKLKQNASVQLKTKLDFGGAKTLF